MLELLIALILIGFVWYVVRLIPMPPVVKQIIDAVAILFIVLFVINAVLQITGHGGMPIRWR